MEEKHSFLLKFGGSYKNLLCQDGSTLFSEINDDKFVLKTSRPGILVSSTSWTEDEDFSVLFSALEGITIFFINF